MFFQPMAWLRNKAIGCPASSGDKGAEEATRKGHRCGVYKADDENDWSLHTAMLLRHGFPIRAAQITNEFLGFSPKCTLCGKKPFCPIRCTSCGQTSCQSCVEYGSKLEDCTWIVPCCGGKTHVYDYTYSLAWLEQAPKWPQSSTYRITYDWLDIKFFHFARRMMKASRGAPSLSYLDLQASGKLLITITLFSEANLKEVGYMIFDGGRWLEDGGHLRLSLNRAMVSGDSGFRTKHKILPAEYLLKEGSLISGAALESVSTLAASGEWKPCLDLRLLPTGNASARKSFNLVKSLRWCHGTSDMILCLCEDSRIVVVKEHEHDTDNGGRVSSRTVCPPHGCWFECGALLCVTFNHKGLEQSMSTHALFFDRDQRTYKGLVTWSYAKARLHAGEVEASPTDMPEAPCLAKSALWRESPIDFPSVDELELPKRTECDDAYHGLRPSNANLVFSDYVGFLLSLMASNGLDDPAYVDLAKQFMKVIELASHFCTCMRCPELKDIQESFSIRHQERVAVTAYSLAGEELCHHYVENVIGASAALMQLTDKLQPWHDTLLQIDLIEACQEDKVISKYSFQAVRLNFGGHDLAEARRRLTTWGLQQRYLPTQLSMVLQGLSASARYQIFQEYFGQLHYDLANLARSPLRGSHYIVLLDVSSSMRDCFLRAYEDEAAEFASLGLDRDVLQSGTNIDIVEHILDSFFVPQLLQSGARIGNAKFSSRVVRVEPTSDNPTPFGADTHLNGGGTEIYRSLMEVAAHLTLPVLDMTGDAGVILITDGEQSSTDMDVANLARIFNRNFRLEVIGIRAQLAGPLKKLVRGSFSVPYQIGNLRNLITSLSETSARIRQRIVAAPESRRDIRQAAEPYHPNMWYLLDED